MSTIPNVTAQGEIKDDFTRQDLANEIGAMRGEIYQMMNRLLDLQKCYYTYDDGSFPQKVEHAQLYEAQIMLKHAHQALDSLGEQLPPPKNSE